MDVDLVGWCIASQPDRHPSVEKELVTRQRSIKIWPDLDIIVFGPKVARYSVVDLGASKRHCTENISTSRVGSAYNRRQTLFIVRTITVQKIKNLAISIE